MSFVVACAQLKLGGMQLSPSIFISYRRSDTASATGRIYDRCIARFGRHSVFKDVDSIPPGVNFRTYIAEVMAKCSVLLAVIGPQWVETLSETGVRRLDELDDPVRLEIEAALACGLTVLPILADGAQMPSAAALPATIRSLADLNAVPAGFDPAFDRDIRRILGLIEDLIAPGSYIERNSGDFDPLPDRQAELIAAADLNAQRGSSLYDGVAVRGRSELAWILRERGWSGDSDARPDQRPQLQGMILRRTSLEGMRLYGADLSGADLREVDLREADLGSVNLRGADLRGARLSPTTTLADTHLDQETKLGDVVWNGARLAQIEWNQLRVLGDESLIRHKGSRRDRIKGYYDASRAYRELALALRQQGLHVPATRYYLRAQVMESRALLHRGRIGAFLTSTLRMTLYGTGEQPMRVYYLYCTLVSGFAIIYWILANDLVPPSIYERPKGTSLTMMQALVVSLRAALFQSITWTPALHDTVPATVMALENILAAALIVLFATALVRLTTRN